MTITAFQTNSENGLAAMAGDLLAKDATWDDSTASNENAQILVLLYQLVRAIKVRQVAAPTTNSGNARDRVFEVVGGHTAAAMMRLFTDIDPIFNELYTMFNSVDDAADSIFGTNLGDNGTGPVGGPIFGSPNYTAGPLGQ